MEISKPNRWGVDRCFAETDLYTINLLDQRFTKIEELFFGEIDNVGARAHRYFLEFSQPSADGDAFMKFIRFMSSQKLRTPKGLKYLEEAIARAERHKILEAMLVLRDMFCAIWTEAIWVLCDIVGDDCGFIISDHPVTVYNSSIFPGSRQASTYGDPDIAQVGTHTVFPLSTKRLLILSNLSWVRNPFQDPTRLRPNPTPFRPTVFNFQTIQIDRKLNFEDVCKINYIIKKRAYRYIAAQKEEWLYPEKYMTSVHWSKIADEYFLMPDPRSVNFTNEFIIGYSGGRADAFDEYGRKPWQPGYKDKALAENEWVTFHRFQGEYARRFGPKRRGRCFQLGRLSPEEDTPNYHEYHLSLAPRRRGRSGRHTRRT